MALVDRAARIGRVADMRWLPSTRAKAAGRHELSTEQRQLVWAVASRLLDYPSDELIADAPALRAVLADLPVSYADSLGRTLDHVTGAPLAQVQAEYVATFDHTRRCALYLTYFAYGDTRRRGVALVRFKQAYRAAGVDFDSDELPDHLCVVLSFGAGYDHDTAWKLLLDHRAGLEVLRLALAAAESPWHDALFAVCAALPPLGADEQEAVRRLIEQGPPAEEVGLAPYALDPSLLDETPYIPAGAEPGYGMLGADESGSAIPEFLGMPARPTGAVR